MPGSSRFRNEIGVHVRLNLPRAASHHRTPGSHQSVRRHVSDCHEREEERGDESAGSAHCRKN